MVASTSKYSQTISKARMKASEFGCNCDGANFSQPNT
ncbi:hypothetical protein A2U01_0069254, partial [Trifolium medium]|nr:hypothetical protein [Trifolium medium]